MLKRFIFCCFVLITNLFLNNLFAQVPKWSDLKLFAGNWYDVGYSIFIDAKDNYYIAGQFQDGIGLKTANFDVDCKEVSAPRKERINAFILRYDSTRKLTLQLTMPGRPMEVKADEVGNIYVVGVVEYDYSFDGITTIPAGGFQDGFLAKYSATGKLLWYRIVKSGDNNSVLSIDIAKNKSIVVCGYANGPMVSLFGTSYIGPICYVSKLDSAGTIDWISIISNNFGSGAVKNRFDLSGNIILAGSILDSLNEVRGMLSKLDGTTGKLIWRKAVGEMGRQYTQRASCVAIAQDGSYIFGGEFSGNGIFDTKKVTAAGYIDIFLLKTDTLGNIKWVTNGGSVGFDKLYDVFQSNSGNIYFTGGYSDGFNIGDSTLKSKGYTDVFAGALEQTGRLKWILHGGSDIPRHESDFFYYEYGAAISEDSKGQVHIVGTTIGNGSFGNMGYYAAESTKQNVFWSTIGNINSIYNVYYPCDTVPVGAQTSAQINVHPNPFFSEFYIQINGASPTTQSFLRIFDSEGRLMGARNLTGNYLYISGLQYLAAGTYFVEVSNNLGEKALKIIKQN